MTRAPALAALATCLYLGCGIELAIAPEPGIDAAAADGGPQRSDAAPRDASVLPAKEGGPEDATVDAAPDAEADVYVPPVIVSMVVLPSADHVRDGDGPIETDGDDDGAFEVVVQGPVIAFALLRTDTEGTPTGGQQWDTYVGADVPPPGLVPTLVTGSLSFQLGVLDGATLQNDATGRFTLPGPATRTLQLYGSDVGTFTPGNSFRLWVESPAHELIAGPVLTLP